MKKGFLSIVSLMLLGLAQAQAGKKPISYKEVKVGSKMPDLPLGDIANNDTHKTRFRDFLGKLVILDFWATSCSSCIAEFPDMEKIQKESDGWVQIFIVNEHETRQQIDDRFMKNFHGKYRLPGLPSITCAKTLGILFPHRGVPFHVWIDPKGIVRVEGYDMNIHNKQKIRDVLDGKPVPYLKENINYAHNKPLYSMISGRNKGLLQYCSLFTKFSDQLAGAYGDGMLNKMDTISSTIRNTHMNTDVMLLYENAVSDSLDRYWEKIIYPAMFRGGTNRGRILLFVKDTLDYTTDFVPNSELTDDMLRRSGFCYEQVVPEGTPDYKRKQYMLEDLNRFFGAMHGTVGQIEKVKMLCYAIVRVEGRMDKLNYKIEGVEGSDINLLLRPVFAKILPDKNDALVLNETGSHGEVNISIPQDISDLSGLKRALQAYGLDIIKKEIEWPMLVIRER